jgi:hypothetical protein
MCRNPETHSAKEVKDDCVSSAFHDCDTMSLELTLPADPDQNVHGSNSERHLELAALCCQASSTNYDASKIEEQQKKLSRLESSYRISKKMCLVILCEICAQIGLRWHSLGLVGVNPCNMSIRKVTIKRAGETSRHHCVTSHLQLVSVYCAYIYIYIGMYIYI